MIGSCSTRRVSPFSLCLLAALALASLPAASSVGAEMFDTYSWTGTIALPPGTDAFDVHSDGRLVLVVDADIYLEDSPGSGVFALHGALPGADMPSFGAAFVRVSPDGTKIAVGNNGGAAGSNPRVGVFDLVDLSGRWLAAGHWDAAWIGDTQLAITAGDFGSPSVVTVLDTDSPDAENPENVLVIDGIGGASAGVVFDAAGNLYTGNGFAGAGPSGTGAVKAFAPGAWQGALAGGPVLDFETSGNLVVDVLSASPLAFDAEGNLIVGGGGEETGFAALVRAQAVLQAVAGGGPADINDPAVVRRLDPNPASQSEFYGVRANRRLGRLYLRDFGAATVHVYTAAIPVPAVSDWGYVVMALVVLTSATLLFRSRPHSRHSRRGGGW